MDLEMKGSGYWNGNFPERQNGLVVVEVKEKGREGRTINCGGEKRAKQRCKTERKRIRGMNKREN